jgi:hypothetical protein
MSDKKKNPGKKKNITREEWKKKYGSDTHYYTHNLDKVDITTGKTLRQLIEDASKKHSIDPAVLAATLFSEGLDHYDMFKEKSNPFTREDYNSHPVSGMRFLGLDTIGNRKNELIKKGYVDPKEYNKNVLEIKTKNEKGEDVISVDIENLGYGIDLTAGFLKNEGDKLDHYLEKNNIELSPIQKTFFNNVAYNAGLGNAEKMISSYNKKGYLKDDNFVYNRPDEYWKEVHKHAYKRTTAGAGLKEQSYFKGGDSNPYRGTQREELTSASTIEAKGLASMEPQERAKTEAISNLKSGDVVFSKEKFEQAEAIKKAPAIVQNREKVTPVSTISKKKAMSKNPRIAITPEVEERIIENLSKMLSSVESNGDYTAVNDSADSEDLQALGKYQFVPRYWWKEIKEFGGKNGYEIETYQDFLNSPSLQDSYFRHYVKETLIPQAKKAFEGENPDNLSFEEVAGFFHYQKPEVAKKAVAEGEKGYREATKKGKDGATVDNLSMKDYRDKMRKAAEANGITPTTEKDVLDPKAKAEVAKGYFDGIEKIKKNSGDLNEKEINQRIQEFQAKYKANGDIYVVKDYIKEENERRTRQSEIDKKKALDTKEKRPKTVVESTKTKSGRRVNDLKGNKPDLNKDLEAWNKDASKTPELELIEDIDVSVIPDLPKEESKEKGKEAPTPSLDGEVTSEWVKDEEEKVKDEGLASQYFEERAQIAEEDNDDQHYNYDASQQKKELPINAITGMALGILGNKQAKEIDIPLRTEDVSEAVRNFTADLAKRAKQGLPPEIEAAMRNQLAEAYQGGLATLVNSSNGNRAAVMGNLGQLENAKARGIVDMNIADYEAKERAFEQYGKAIQYIDSFEANRDIANHGIEYNEALRQKKKAEDLATSGFAMLNEELQYQRENGPGSANSMYRSMMMQRMFGFDPNMKDDGSGTVPGTKSYFDKQKAKKKEAVGLAVNSLEKYQSLNPDQKKVVESIAQAEGGDKAMRGIVDYLHNNPNADLAQIKADNLDLALKQNDFGLLGMDREEAISFKAPKMPSLATPGINGSPTAQKQSGGLTGPEFVMSKLQEQSGVQERLLPGLLGGGQGTATNNPIIETDPEKTTEEINIATALTEQVEEYNNYYNNQ